MGPASVRSSCFDCHPEYGHGKRKAQYETRYGNGNGYLLVVYHPTSEGSNDGGYITEVTGMPQTQAQSPFLPPIDESKINMSWLHVAKMETDEIPTMQFPDGEKFDLIYPEITIPQSAFNTDPVPSNYAVRLESTIGIGGTGLIDAIPSENFKIYETEGKNIVSAKVIGTDGAGHSALAALLNDNGINVLICGGIGNGAVAALSEAGIEVYSGADGEADAAVEAYLNGDLKSAGVNCDHHHEHEEGHGCGHCGSHEHEDELNCGSGCGGCGGGCGTL